MKDYIIQLDEALRVVISITQYPSIVLQWKDDEGHWVSKPSILERDNTLELHSVEQVHDFIKGMSRLEKLMMLK